tara:strand:+ start:9513 stop:9659 length:147 start_codon:yes stop_codon:yes gene_type:complete
MKIVAWIAQILCVVFLFFVLAGLSYWLAIALFGYGIYDRYLRDGHESE